MPDTPAPWRPAPRVVLDTRLPCADRLRALPPELADVGLRLVAEMRSQIPASASGLADAVRVRTGGRFQDEAAAWAGVLGADWRDVLLGNVAYDLVLNFLACSTAVLETSGGPALARNMDFWPVDLLALASVDLRFERPSGGFTIAGWPGSIGAVTAMSDRGFAVALNAVFSSERPPPTGYPVLLHLRRVIEDAASFDDAVARLESQPLAASALFIVCGARNDERVVVERTPRRAHLRWAVRGEPLIATNEYRGASANAESSNQLARTACRRFEALSRLLAAREARRDATDAELLYILSDPDVLQNITAQHIIARPARRSLQTWTPRRHHEPAGRLGASP